ncbi:MAG: FkbM family methyltransferase [Burkholderiales bacterium]
MNLTKLIDVNSDTLFGKLLRLPLRLLPGRMVVPVLRGVNKGYRWRVGSNIHGCWLGTYESDKQKLMSRLVKPGMIAYDIGANAGFYTLALARMVGGEGAVYAFEPYAENALNILEHLQLNRCHNATLYQAAVSDHISLSAFQVARSNSMGSLGEVGHYWVPTVAIDALIETANLPVPDIVKMDVEGAESSVFDGASKLLGMRKTIWIIALHGADQRKEIGRMLLDHGYGIYRLDGSAIAAGNIDVDEIYALSPQ